MNKNFPIEYEIDSLWMIFQSVAYLWDLHIIMMETIKEEDNVSKAMGSIKVSLFPNKEFPSSTTPPPLP